MALAALRLTRQKGNATLIAYESRRPESRVHIHAGASGMADWGDRGGKSLSSVPSTARWNDVESQTKSRPSMFGKGRRGGAETGRGWIPSNRKAKRLAFDLLHTLSLHYICFIAIHVSDILFIVCGLNLMSTSLPEPYTLVWVFAFFFSSLESCCEFRTMRKKRSNRSD